MVPLEGVTLVEERCWRVAMYVGGHLKSPPGLEGWHSGYSYHYQPFFLLTHPFFASFIVFVLWPILFNQDFLCDHWAGLSTGAGGVPKGLIAIANDFSFPLNLSGNSEFSVLICV